MGQKAFLFACACLLLMVVSCTSTHFTVWQGERVVSGRGGTLKIIEGFDFWMYGQPDREYSVIGVIDDSRSAGLFGGNRYKAIAALARQRGADAVILVGSTLQATGVDPNSGAIAYRRDSKVLAVKYVSRPRGDQASATAALLQGLDMDKVRERADKGDAIAQFALGVAYHAGHGIKMDYAQALKWFESAANQSFAPARNALALMYDEGHGVQKNTGKALELFHQAANQGDAAAQTNLGFRYGNGIGVPQDYIEAYKWWSLAAAQGEQTALENRNLVAARMTAEQLAEGQRRAISFTPQR